MGRCKVRGFPFFVSQISNQTKRPFMKKLKFRKCRKPGENFSKQREHDKFQVFFPFPIVPQQPKKKKCHYEENENHEPERTVSKITRD